VRYRAEYRYIAGDDDDGDDDDAAPGARARAVPALRSIWCAPIASTGFIVARAWITASERASRATREIALSMAERDRDKEREKFSNADPSGRVDDVACVRARARNVASRWSDLSLRSRGRDLIRAVESSREIALSKIGKSIRYSQLESRARLSFVAPLAVSFRSLDKKTANKRNRYLHAVFRSLFMPYAINMLHVFCRCYANCVWIRRKTMRARIFLRSSRRDLKRIFF